MFLLWSGAEQSRAEQSALSDDLGRLGRKLKDPCSESNQIENNLAMANSAVSRITSTLV